MLLDCSDHVLTTTGLESTVSAQQRRQAALIKSDQSNCNYRRHFAQGLGYAGQVSQGRVRQRWLQIVPANCWK